MNSRESKKLETKYFKMKLNKVIDEHMILDEECHRDVISSLNELIRDMSNSSFIDYSNKPVMKSIMLDIFPDLFFLQSEFGSEIYVCLLSYYEFLYSENVLTKEEYSDMLLFFQVNMFPFFKKLALAADDTDANFSGVIEELFLSRGANQGESKKKLANNVIQMPGGYVGKVVHKPRLLQFRIDLEGFKPPVWRRVKVPETITFEMFHQVIQSLFEWEDWHLHSFKTKIGDINNEGKRLNSLPEEALEKMTYLYDFGDDWSHKIVLEDIFESQSDGGMVAHCLKAVNDAPMEDSGMTGERGHSSLEEINKRLAKLEF